jgi:hypothetical protein
MPKSKSRKRKLPNRVLALRDLEHVKAAGLTAACGQRTHDHAIREFVALLFGLQLPFQPLGRAPITYPVLRRNSANHD